MFPNRFIVRSYVLWRIAIFIAIFLAPYFIKLNQHFLGGGMQSYLSNPLFWSMANFDGEHYISIAAHGYRPLLHYFFPVYPLLINWFSFSDSPFSLVLSGQIISNVALLMSLFGIWKIVNLDYKKDIAITTILLLLLFPTSFYFVSVYTESLFLALAVWSLYLARKKHWIMSIILASVASATRIIGIFMLPILLVEWIIQYRDDKNITGLLLLPFSLLGFAIYLYFLYQQTGDIFAFKTGMESVYGAQRSDALVLLPQVFYRYIFKIIPNMNWAYLQGSFSLLLEFSSAILFFILSIIGWFKLRRSYAIFLLVGFLVPTFSGSFSSMSRYVLVLFPGFILLAIYFNKLNETLKSLIYIILTVTAAISMILFSRGYWVA